MSHDILFYFVFKREVTRAVVIPIVHSMLITEFIQSNRATPEIPIPDFSSDQEDSQYQSGLDLSQETYNQTRRANVQTLHQMFPELDEEIVEDVLEGCGDDLGVAIDRLLEM